MTTKARRQGGLQIDPAVAKWQDTAALNLAALSKKQRRDRERVRVKYDILPEMKAAIEAEAKEIDTSASQVAAFLLAWALKEYAAGNADLRQAVRDAMMTARTLKFAHNLTIPEEWMKTASDGDN